jgi:hypothetical protein
MRGSLARDHIFKRSSGGKEVKLVLDEVDRPEEGTVCGSYTEDEDMFAMANGVYGLQRRQFDGDH